ncbi:stage III sporulation protein SpoAB [Sporomusa ovata DSM 2662]|uniref:Stage III sporulation protein AB n=1 Tax=Sporomusa ovata TaxID=2378 RepID=A0A0U1L402_9FIRM|nr:stage III sporulation protein SpoIIIAB [Sporomusa ovata]EQB25484.1 stage III sporulation protein AB [Sporomusa ovata DSM 2662]CQR74049.1 Stage III sporulation protein AB [Sporomusa ovata]
MWLKILGSLLIIVAGTAMGFSVAARYVERPRQIRQLISCLSALQSHINYAAIPLPGALSQCTSGIAGPVADFFNTMSLLLLNNGWLTPQAAMDQALMESKQLVLNQPEREILTVFSANLGSMDREEQHKSLELVQEQLSRIQYEAEKLCEQNVKMYRYLGLCSGLAIVIILV